MKGPTATGSLDRFAEHLRQELRLSPLTVQTYRRLAAHGLDFRSSEEKSPWSLEQWLGRWAAHLRGDRGLGARTIALHWAALKHYLTWMAQCEGLPPPIFPRLKQAGPKIRRPWILTPDQIQHLLSFSPEHPLEWRDQAILESFYSCGFRLHELAHLQQSDLQWEDGLARVEGKGSKVRWVPIGQQALTSIRHWYQIRKVDSPYVFTKLSGEPMTHRAIQKRVALWTEKRLGRRYHPHALRHALATHLLSASQNLRAIQEILGHAKLSTTQGYTHLDLATLIRRYDEAHPKQRSRPSGPPL